MRLLSFWIGNEISHSELGRQLGIGYKTVARYLDLFEKTFILFNLRGFSRNLRKEVTKKSKYFFLIWEFAMPSSPILIPLSYGMTSEGYGKTFSRSNVSNIKPMSHSLVIIIFGGHGISKKWIGWKNARENYIEPPLTNEDDHMVKKTNPKDSFLVKGHTRENEKRRDLLGVRSWSA